MDFSRFTDGIVSFAQNNPIIAILLAVGVLFFIYRKPKLFLGLLGLGLLLAGLFYLIMSISGQGSEKKKALTHEKEEQSDTIR
jgi:multisubunit Na+/H+ antiporter MnhC subunit